MAFTPADLARRRSLRAVHLRALGQTYEQIAQALLPCPPHERAGGDRTCVERGGGCLPMYAHRRAAKAAVDRALEQEYAAGADTRDQLRRHQLAQIDLLLQGVMRDALGATDDRHPARLAAVRYLDQRAKIMGLYAPTRVVVTDELDAKIAELLEDLGAAGLGTPVPTE